MHITQLLLSTSTDVYVAETSSRIDQSSWDMHQIKAEWFLFHIIYVTQLLFLGHTTHFVKVRHTVFDPFRADHSAPGWPAKIELHIPSLFQHSTWCVPSRISTYLAISQLVARPHMPRPDIPDASSQTSRFLVYKRISRIIAVIWL